MNCYLPAKKYCRLSFIQKIIEDKKFCYLASDIKTRSIHKHGQSLLLKMYTRKLKTAKNYKNFCLLMKWMNNDGRIKIGSGAYYTQQSLSGVKDSWIKLLKAANTNLKIIWIRKKSYKFQINGCKNYKCLTFNQRVSILFEVEIDTLMILI